MTAEAQQVPDPDDFVGDRNRNGSDPGSGRTVEVLLREDTVDYTPTAHNVTIARRRTAQRLTEWGRSALAGDASLVVSELASNALLHACVRGRLIRVRLALTATVLRIEVSDPRGERPPLPRTAGACEESGRGLLIVGQLADRWGVEPRTVGKTVFAELRLRPASGDVVPTNSQAIAPG